MDTIEAKIKIEFTLASLMQDQSSVGFEAAEGFWLTEIENLAPKLPGIEVLVPRTTGGKFKCATGLYPA